MEQEFTTLNINEVIHVANNASPLRAIASTDTFKVGLLLERIERGINKALLDGAKCEVIKLDQVGWKKGVVRIKKIELEFSPYPDEVDRLGSPLDELRKSEVD